LVRIFVGNHPFTVTEDDLTTLFAQFGTVNRVLLATDQWSGRPRGFSFVEMPKQEEAEAAIAALNGTSLGGRPLTINEAKPRAEHETPRRARW
jgi:RNA recognition motif-containing protein